MSDAEGKNPSAKIQLVAMIKSAAVAIDERIKTSKAKELKPADFMPLAESICRDAFQLGRAEERRSKN